MNIDGTKISMIRGDDESLTVTAGYKKFMPGDMVEITVRQYAGLGTKVLHKVATEFTEDGKAEFHFSPQDTGMLAFGTYSYDCQVTFQDIGVKTIIPPSTFEIKMENTYD